jgi:ATP:ADP antiporter, AAA family
MAARQWYIKIFNVRPGEAKAVSYLMTFSFFVGLSMTFYFAASNAIFIQYFEPYMIPLSYIVSGFVVWIAWWLLSRLDRKLPIQWQVIIKFVFVFVTVSAISSGVWFLDAPWLVFVMFTWIRILVYITLVTFWGLAGRMFNIQQGKRVFGLLGVGEVVSIIIGYFSVPFLLQFLKTPDLLFLSSASLFICLIIVFVILRVFKDQLSDGRASAPKAKVKTNEKLNYWEMVKKPYFMFISLMALVPIFGYLFIDFLFLAQTKVEFANNPETIAGFLGVFLGFVAIVEFGLKFLSGRILNRYGLKAGLVSLPVILLAGVFFAALSGTIYGAAGMFFAFIALARLFERSIRAGVYEPAFQLLYQPVPAEQRLIFQNQIEGIPKASGTVITGVFILLFSAVHYFNLVHYSWILVMVLALWVWIALQMYEQYRNMLKAKLSELKTESSMMMRPEIKRIKTSLSSAGMNTVNKIYMLFENIFPLESEKMLPELFKESAFDVKKFLLHRIADKHLLSVLPFLRKEVNSLHSGDLAELLQQTITQLEDNKHIKIKSLVVRCRSKDPAVRSRLAAMLGSSGRYETIRLLIELMQDADAEVRRTAIISAGKTKRIELLPHILDNLMKPEFSGSARKGLEIIGEPALDELERVFEKSGSDVRLKGDVIAVFESVGSKKALYFLRSKIFYPDNDIRRLVHFSLGKLAYKASIGESTGIRSYIEDIIENLLWIQASLLDLENVKADGGVQLALLDHLEAEKEYVFVLLSLLYDSKTIQHIREYVESKDANAKVYALEMSDILIDDEVKQLFFPLFEDISIKERLQRLEYKFPQEQMAAFDRLADILNREQAKVSLWAKACALDVIDTQAKQHSEKLKTLLASFLVHPQPLLAELAARKLNQADPTFLDDAIRRLSGFGHAGTDQKSHWIARKKQNGELTLFEKVKAVKSIDDFVFISEYQIVKLLEQYPEVKFKKLVPGDETEGNGDVIKEYVSADGYAFTLNDEMILNILYDSPSFLYRLLGSHSTYTQNEGL